MHPQRVFAPGFAPRAGAISGHFRTVLVTGGCGFLGSNLCDQLIYQGHNVICVDNLETGRLQNIAHLLHNPNFRFYQHDIVEPFGIEGRIHQIYNLACPASPSKYQSDPIHTFRTSVDGALNLLALAKVKEARILQSSTSEVYGDPEISPQPESYRGRVNTVGPRACYDESKRAAETLFYEMNLRHGVDTRLARIFNTYGPRMDPSDGRVVSNFVVQALTGAPITVYGDGSQTRSFCYVTDMLSGLMALMNVDTAGPDPVNIGNPGEFTIIEAAQLVVQKTGSRSKIVFKDLPKDDPLQRRPDISRAKSILGWEPKVPFFDGLDRTITYFREEIARDVGFHRGAS